MNCGTLNESKWQKNIERDLKKKKNPRRGVFVWNGWKQREFSCRFQKEEFVEPWVRGWRKGLADLLQHTETRHFRPFFGFETILWIFPLTHSFLNYRNAKQKFQQVLKIVDLQIVENSCRFTNNFVDLTTHRFYRLLRHLNLPQIMGHLRHAPMSGQWKVPRR